MPDPMSSEGDVVRINIRPRFENLVPRPTSPLFTGEPNSTETRYGSTVIKHVRYGPSGNIEEIAFVEEEGRARAFNMLTKLRDMKQLLEAHTCTDCEKCWKAREAIYIIDEIISE